MSRIRWTNLILLGLLLALTACQPGGPTATPAAATQAPDEAAAPTATPAALPDAVGPLYAAQLRAALEVCAGVARNEVCLGQGAVTLTAADGAAAPALAQPGDRADLAQVTGLSLGGGEDWGIAVLSLAGGLDDPDQNLTVVAMGPAEITDLVTVLPEDGFAWTFGAPDDPANVDPETPVALDDLPAITEVEPLQRLTLSSGPASDVPSGLFLMSPWEGDMAAVQINGAAIALGSMAFIQTEPGGAITVGMFEGGSLVTVGEATFSVPAGAQATFGPTVDAAAAPAGNVTVLDPRADAIARAVAQSGLPERDPRAEAISAAVEQYGQASDPRADAISDAVAQYSLDVARYYVQKYRQSIRRCTDPARANAARYVYNVLYWDNVLDSIYDTPEFQAVLGQNGFAQLQDGARRCLRFELDFSSTVQVTSAKVSYVSEVKAEAVKLQFVNTGFLERADDGVLSHVRYEVTGEEGGCPSSEVAEDGTLLIAGGFVRVYQNVVEILLDLNPQVPFEKLVLNCAGTILDLPFPWAPVFGKAHEEEFIEGLYRFYDWNVSGREHFAEVIYETPVPMDAAEGLVTTYMVLVHTPQAAP